jgi:NitT/TauT family transport system substrate-binding protein
MIQQTFDRKGPETHVLLVRLAALSLIPLIFLSSGCGSTSADSSLHQLTVGLTYVPNIQFAPFYVAEALGYYKAAGLDVTLRHQGVNEGEFNAIAAGQEDAIFAGGDEILQATSQAIPLTYVAEIYTQYPVALIVPASSSIHTAADLRGHTIGIPGLYGTSYIALKAFLQSAGLSQSDVNVEAIGYTQPAALIGHKVDAVIDYVNDGVTAYAQSNFLVRTLALQQPIVSNGIGVRNSVLRSRGSDIRALIKATLQGVEYTIAHPARAVQLSGAFVPGLNDPTAAANALATLQATIPFWERSDGKPLGYTAPTLWQEMYVFLHSGGQLTKSVDVAMVYTNAYLPSA